MKKLLVALIVVLAYSCTSDNSNLVVKGNIKGLKKGVVYLSRALDSSFQVLDSMVLNGTSDFLLKGHVDEPEVLVLRLDANSTKENSIKFFANEGVTEINTTLKRFAFDYKINGSPQQKILDAYNDVARRFNYENLDLLKLQFEALNQNDSIAVDSINNLSQNNLKRKYLFTINYAINNKDSEVAPYLALSEIYDANVKYLDTIYNALPETIENSKYGKSLLEYITERKEQEDDNGSME